MGSGESQRSHGPRHLRSQLRRLCAGGSLGRTVAGCRHQSVGLCGDRMSYSYTQISHYLTCPRRYRHRYLDGWREKDTRAAMLFGRAFESALAAFFRREDSAAVLFREWSACRNQDLQYSTGDSWDRMLQQGIQLLERFCQDGRVRIRQPRRNLQVKVARSISPQNEFVAYIDAIGYLDGL